MAKFRGDSEDWLDTDKPAFSGKSARRPKGRSQSKAHAASSVRGLNLDPKDANALVIEVFSNQCKVLCDEFVENREENSPQPASHSYDSPFLCTYRRSSIFGTLKSEQRERTPVAVGDRVRITRTGMSGIVEGVSRRKNSLSRIAPGRESGKVHHILAANIDCVAIVSSAKEPPFSPGVIDRFLVAAEAEKIPSVIIVSKIDLLTDQELANSPWGIYRQLGYEVIEVSAKTREGLSILASQIQSKTAVFCGHSGVGKTSILRLLLNQEVGKVGAVSTSTGKGTHTTTGAILFSGANASQWIDTPGIREFSLARVAVEELKNFFPEFRTLSCTSKACLHDEEKGCSARNLTRYSSYRHILLSLKERAKEKAKDKES